MSIADSNMLTQKEVTRMTTRRDTIMMPSQTPMVPWKVRRTLFFLLDGTVVQKKNIYIYGLQFGLILFFCFCTTCYIGPRF